MIEQIKDGGPAFPRSGAEYGAGTTLRDYFAAKAMQVIRANPDFALRHDPDAVADRAYEQADAMLKARET